ncbi:N-acetyltransferase [Salinigranum rubrum]|uniref:N-acetyltransferase n=1 Tax=Salinigranum rubrum TaxID=755307 RepID=A0A2I8VQ17_9EURY|nr:N-acetyltransferase [Salinigranum rubrum]
MPDDESRLHDLQSHLDEGAPTLLDAAISGTFGECLVAVDDSDSDADSNSTSDRAVGYLLAAAGDGGVPPSGVAPDDTLDGDAPTVHVSELVVAPDARRQGHASALLATLLSRHPGATVTLTVAPDNDAARALYERFGFEVSRELPDFFDDGPGLLLVRRSRSE